jgi:hypothetical protein
MNCCHRAPKNEYEVLQEGKLQDYLLLDHTLVEYEVMFLQQEVPNSNYFHVGDIYKT